MNGLKEGEKVKISPFLFDLRVKTRSKRDFARLIRLILGEWYRIVDYNGFDLSVSKVNVFVISLIQALLCVWLKAVLKYEGL